jgi:hypothetical protein
MVATQAQTIVYWAPEVVVTVAVPFSFSPSGMAAPLLSGVLAGVLAGVPLRLALRLLVRRLTTVTVGVPTGVDEPDAVRVAGAGTDGVETVEPRWLGAGVPAVEFVRVTAAVGCGVGAGVRRARLLLLTPSRAGEAGAVTAGVSVTSTDGVGSAVVMAVTVGAATGSSARVRLRSCTQHGEHMIAAERGASW